MLSILVHHKVITGLILVLFLSSIVIQMVIGLFFRELIRETENMASTDKELLRQCKRKFTNCYKLNAGVLNVPVFVDKFLNKISVGRVTVTGLKHLSGQLMLLSVFVCGMGACIGIISGETIGEILPYYIISLFALYIYFSVSSIVDVTGKRRVLKTNLVDYLENNMVNKLTVLEEDLKTIEKEPEQEKKENRKEERHRTLFGKSEEKELEELLKEFLT